MHIENTANEDYYYYWSSYDLEFTTPLPILGGGGKTPLPPPPHNTPMGILCQ